MEGSDQLAIFENEKATIDSESLHHIGIAENRVRDYEKSLEIEEACEDHDLSRLAGLSILPGGFMNDNLRAKAWPLLLGITAAQKKNKSELDWNTLPKHRDEAQVELDVNRSFIYYPDNDSASKLEARRLQLSSIIVATLRQYPMLCYFQGFHDIVQVLLLVLGYDLAVDVIPRLAILRIRDFMLPILSPSFQHLQLLPAIVTVVDTDLARHLAPAHPFFALSSTLTMFAHDIEDYQMIARLFDFLLAHEASLSMYLFATIIISRRKELFEIEPDDADMLHFTLSKLPKTLDMDELILKAMTIFEQHPPESLPLRAWKRISPYSVLRTTRSTEASAVPRIQSLDEGINFFNKQAAQVSRQEFKKRLQSSLWKYRRPVGGIGVAVLVGVISIWMQQNNNERSYSTIFNIVASKLNNLFSPSWSI